MLLVIIDNLDVRCVPFFKLKTYAPLFIDAYAVLVPPVAFQFLEPVGRRNAQVLELSRAMQVVELAQGDRRYFSPFRSDGGAMK